MMPDVAAVAVVAPHTAKFIKLSLKEERKFAIKW